MMMPTTPSNITIHKVTETVSIQNDVFSDIAIRPPSKQYLCVLYGFVWRFLPIGLLLLMCYRHDMPLAFAFCLLPLFVLIPLTLYRLLYLYSSIWIIGAEVIRQKRGVFSASTVYFELRRVTGYYEQQSWLQRLLGLKNILVVCSDKGYLQIEIKGIPTDFPLLDVIRQRAERCKIINLARSFTTFCAQTALSLRSKYSQKLYEFCCEFSGNYRYPRAKSYDLAFKKNVFPIRIDQLRYLLDLSEKRDERTGKVLSKEKYPNYKDLKRNVLLPAQKELYELYHQGNSEVWFDCVPYQKEGRKIVSLLLIIYTKKHPKEGLQKLWEEGDEPLNPFEEFTGAALVQKEKQASCSCPASQELVSQVEKKLETYLESHEVVYYLNYIQTKVGGTYDAYNQVLQVLKDKEKQKKFQQGTRAYQRTSIMHYALQENLKEFGWNIPELKRRTFCSA